MDLSEVIRDAHRPVMFVFDIVASSVLVEAVEWIDAVVLLRQRPIIRCIRR